MNSMLFIVAAAAAGAVLPHGVSEAAEIRVLSTQATEQAYRELAPRFEKESGHKVTTIFTGTLDLQKRIAAGETCDLIIMAGPAIDDYITAGKVVPGSRVDLAKSGVGVGVRAGAPKPDIGSTEALKKALHRSAIPPAPAVFSSSRCSNAWASPTRWPPSSSRPRPAFSSAASLQTAKSRSVSSR
jgi:ABC-type molybdate transport system substrate-binding protein